MPTVLIIPINLTAAILVPAELLTVEQAELAREAYGEYIKRRAMAEVDYACKTIEDCMEQEKPSA